MTATSTLPGWALLLAALLILVLVIAGMLALDRVRWPKDHTVRDGYEPVDGERAQRMRPEK